MRREKRGCPEASVNSVIGISFSGGELGHKGSRGTGHEPFLSDIENAFPEHTTTTRPFWSLTLKLSPDNEKTFSLSIKVVCWGAQYCGKTPIWGKV